MISRNNCFNVTLLAIFSATYCVVITCTTVLFCFTMIAGMAIKMLTLSLGCTDMYLVGVVGILWGLVFNEDKEIGSGL